MCISNDLLPVMAMSLSVHVASIFLVLDLVHCDESLRALSEDTRSTLWSIYTAGENQKREKESVTT